MSGYTGDIVLATSPTIDEKLKSFLKEHHVITYPLFVKCKSKLQCSIQRWFTKIEGTLPMAIIRHYLYLSWMQHYDADSLVMVLDFRDTVFHHITATTATTAATTAAAATAATITITATVTITTRCSSQSPSRRWKRCAGKPATSSGSWASTCRTNV